MIAFARIFFGALVTFLGSVLSSQDAAARPAIAQAHGVITYSSTPSKCSHAFPIKTVNGTIAYDLSLEPDIDVWHHVVGLDLVLHRAGNKSDAPNLFYARGRVHGYQKFIFAASDFANGIQKSIYGKSRNIELNQFAMKIEIDVTRVVVIPIQVESAKSPDYQFDALALQITVRK